MEHLFQLKQRKTNIRTEIAAGLTTYCSIIYIVSVLITMLSLTGMKDTAVFSSVLVSSGIGCIIMGLLSNYPIALAPSLGVTALFVTTICGRLGYSWRAGLAAVFIAGILFLILALTGVRGAIMHAIPAHLKCAISGGTGCFLTFIGLKNSAIIVSVGPEDFGSKEPLSGVAFQQKWEEKAFREGNGKIPVQLLRDFRSKTVSKEYGEIRPNTKGETTFGNLRNCLPEEVCDSICEGMEAFERKIKGFNRPDTILCGIEARTSSPVRILRDRQLESSIRGLYPCGEGAGYAGGITSAAVDGIRVAEAVAAQP